MGGGVLPTQDGYFHIVSGEPPVEPLPDRHHIEVFVDGGWAHGELRRVKVVDGVEVHTVRYVDPDGQPHVGNFPAGLVRPDETGPDAERWAPSCATSGIPHVGVTSLVGT